MAKHTIATLWTALKEAIVSEDPEESLLAIRDDIVEEAKKEVREEQAARSVLTTGEAKEDETVKLDSSGKA